MTKGQRGRQLARAELRVAGFIIFVVQPFLFIGAPRMMGGRVQAGRRDRSDRGAPALRRVRRASS